VDAFGSSNENNNNNDSGLPKTKLESDKGGQSPVKKVTSKASVIPF
jgi:hypothetical protein